MMVYTPWLVADHVCGGSLSGLVFNTSHYILTAPQNRECMIYKSQSSMTVQFTEYLRRKHLDKPHAELGVG